VNNKIKEFTDLEAWKKGHEFTIDVYRLTGKFPKQETYGIVSQLRRAAASITANIAEGFSRYSYRDKIRFYYNSRGSISECQNYFLIARDVGYLGKNDAEKMIFQADRIRQILNGLIRSSENIAGAR